MSRPDPIVMSHIQFVTEHSERGRRLQNINSRSCIWTIKPFLNAYFTHFSLLAKDKLCTVKQRALWHPSTRCTRLPLWARGLGCTGECSDSSRVHFWVRLGSVTALPQCFQVPRCHLYLPPAASQSPLGIISEWK